jgi:hypothetical protein
MPARSTAPSAATNDNGAPTALGDAILTGNLRAAQRCLARQPELIAQPCAWGMPPLTMAAWAGHRALVEFLLPLSDPNAASGQYQETALMKAAHAGAPDLVALLAPVSDPNARSLNGQTALMKAAAAGHLDCILELLPYGGARLQQTHAGSTALMLAAQHGFVECVGALLPHSDPNAVDANGLTALMAATRPGGVECVRALVPASDLSVQNNAGQTALGRAADAYARFSARGAGAGDDYAACADAIAVDPRLDDSPEREKALAQMGLDALPQTRKRMRAAIEGAIAGARAGATSVQSVPASAPALPAKRRGLRV